MKKLLFLSLFLVILFAAVGFYSCSKNNTPEDTTVAVTGVSISETSHTLEFLGDQFQLTATLTPSDASNKGVTWSVTSTPAQDVVSVTPDPSNSKKCTVQGLGTKGSATVTVTTKDGSFTASCVVTYSANPVAMQDATMNVTGTLDLPIGTSYKLSVGAVPFNAVIKQVTWTFVPRTDQTADPSALANPVAGQADPNNNINAKQIFFDDTTVFIGDYQKYLDRPGGDGTKGYDPAAPVIDFTAPYVTTQGHAQEAIVQSNLFADYLKLGKVGKIHVVVEDLYSFKKTFDIDVNITMAQPKIEMVDIPAGGVFNMGIAWSPETGNDYHWGPQKAQITKPYKLGKYTISQGLWLWVYGSGDDNFYMGRMNSFRVRYQHRPYYTLDAPAFGMSWNEAVDFIAKLNAKTGSNYRLPTYCEMEWAARGATDDTWAWNAGPDHSTEACPGWSGNVQYDANNPAPCSGDIASYANKYRMGYTATGGGGIDYYQIKDGSHAQDVYSSGKLVDRWGNAITGGYAPNTFMLGTFLKYPTKQGVYAIMGSNDQWCSDWFNGNNGNSNWGGVEIAVDPQGPSAAENAASSAAGQKARYGCSRDWRAGISYFRGADATAKGGHVSFRLAQ